MDSNVDLLDNCLNVMALEAVTVGDDLNGRHVIQDSFEFEALLGHLHLLVLQEGTGFDQADEAELMGGRVGEREDGAILGVGLETGVYEFFFVLGECFLVVAGVDAGDVGDRLREGDEVDVCFVPLHRDLLLVLFKPGGGCASWHLQIIISRYASSNRKAIYSCKCT